MSLIDDAKRLAEIDPIGLRAAKYADNDMSYCHWCEQEKSAWSSAPLEHAPDCPWLSIPLIVAALEAANEVAVYIRHLRRHDERLFEMISATQGFRSSLRAFDDRFHEALDA